MFARRYIGLPLLRDGSSFDSEVPLKFTITRELGSAEIIEMLPSRYRRRAELAPLREGRFHLLMFAATNDAVVLSGAVKRALKQVPADEGQLVVAAPGFTMEGLELLRSRDAIVYTLGDVEWTDVSYQRVRQATRLPREGSS